MSTSKIDVQTGIEERFSQQHVSKLLREFTQDSDAFDKKVFEGMKLIENWLQQDFFPSKKARLQQLKYLDLEELVKSIYRSTMFCQKPVLFTAAVAMTVNHLGWDDKPAAIQTMAELLAVLCKTDVFDIFKESKISSLMLVSRANLGKISTAMEMIQYMPPMIVEPLEVNNNRDTGYLTLKESLILGGKHNHHEGNICLDVLDIQNKVCLKIDVEFLNSYKEVPKKALETKEAEENWYQFKKKSDEMYRLVLRTGNKVWLTHRVDVRGRMYAQGYHLNSQGASFKKALLELYKEELVTGSF